MATLVRPADALEAIVARYDPSVIDVPGGRARIRLEVPGERTCDVTLRGSEIRLRPVAREDREPDAVLKADAATWARMSEDLRGGMEAFGADRLSVRGNLHVGVGFLAATSGSDEPRRLRFGRLRARGHGRIAYLEAGEGPPVLCLPGLGGTKASFLTTVADLAEHHRVIAIDLPGFGDSTKPIGAAYDAPFFADATVAALDALGLDRAHLVGNSMGGRVALEVAMDRPERVDRLVLLSPALAWLKKNNTYLRLLKFVRPELGLIQPSPRPIVERIVRSFVPGAHDGWAAAGVDEFLRAYLHPRGRAAFYAAARNIYLDEPHGDDGFWTRLREVSPDAMFVWGKHDQLVPIGFMRHVEEALPAARHVELNCGHVPQVEAPEQTHAAMLRFFRAA